MSNLRRLRVTDRIFFVTVNLRRGVGTFSASEYPLMIQVLDRSRRRLGFLLCGYVLMPDHWHALIWASHPLTISEVIHDVKKVSALRLHESRASSGPLWQRQFWDRFVRHAKEFGDRLDYMHLNPVQKSLVSRPEDWKWSSYNNFSLDKRVVVECPTRIDYVRLPEGYRG